MGDSSTHQAFPAGEMERLIRDFDWSKTPLGPIETWSPALRTMTSVMLANRFPLLLWWGPDQISLYNDAYIPVLGMKHLMRSVCPYESAGRRCGTPLSR